MRGKSTPPGSHKTNWCLALRVVQAHSFLIHQHFTFKRGWVKKQKELKPPSKKFCHYRDLNHQNEWFWENIFDTECSGTIASFFWLWACDEHWTLRSVSMKLERMRLEPTWNLKVGPRKTVREAWNIGGSNRKDLQIYAKPELGNRCVVGCFQLYLSLNPKEEVFIDEHCVAHLPGFHASG